MKEVWKPIKDFETTHMVSNLGRFKSLPWIQKHSSGSKFLKKEKIVPIREGVAFNGYSNVMLTKNGKQHSLFAHRVIAIAFIPNPKNKRCINHKNGVKTDNRIDNLEWVTHSENSRHSFANGLQLPKRGIENHNSKITDIDVLKIRKRYLLGESSYKIWKTLDMSYTNVKDIIAKRTWSHV